MFNKLVQYIKPTFHYENVIYHSSNESGLFAGYKLYFGNEYIAMIDYGINYKELSKSVVNNPYIIFVNVRDEFRHKHYGSDIMKYFENQMKEEGYNQIYVYPSTGVEPFYIKNGFQKCPNKPDKERCYVKNIDK